MTRRHVHKYIRRNIGSEEQPREIYACSFPDCTHFMPSNALVIGKQSICWQCDEVFNMHPEQVRKLVKKPRCQSCRTKDPIDPIEEQKLSEAIDILGKLKL